MQENCVLYEELRPAEFVDRLNECPVAYIPLGTLEWHGYHLPLGADGIQSQNIFKILANLVGGIVLPMVFLGPDCKEHKNGKDFYGMDVCGFEEDNPQQLIGSAYYMEENQFEQLLNTILSNLKRAGFKIVIAHGHGPPTNFFAKRKQFYKEKIGIDTYTLWDLGSPTEDGIMTDHAAANETSLVMALRPDLVNINRLENDTPPVAVWGKDPRLNASIEEGRKLIQLNIKTVSKKIENLVKNISYDKVSVEYKNVKNLLS